MDMTIAGLLVAGFTLLVVGAEFLVRGAAKLAALFGISPLVIGLTVVAYGTSTPELAVSMQAGLSGSADIAIANVVGSNIFNILSILGIASLVTPGGLVVAPAMLRFDLIVMTAVAFACLPIFFSGYTIARWEGILFFGGYIAYTVYLILTALNHEALPTFTNAMLFFVLPIMVITLTVVGVRSLQTQDKQKTA